ncbi:MAG: NAD(P)-dependent glycerol-3-phosphate dehydrogenase [Clostridia bacterium]|nr:NAD(P)-dependent glycerol-3-phosphate dehydrogenase [Clostridia bacterium]
MNICILGSGTWGMALAMLLKNNEHAVKVWSAIPEEIELLKKNGTHKNLPGVVFPDGIDYTTDMEYAIDGAEMVLFVVPSQFIRSTAKRCAEYLKDGIIIANAAKGIECGTLMTLTEVIEDEVKKQKPNLEYKICALSGPTHAEEVARGLPTSIVSACEDEQTSFRIAKVFANSCMRVYANTDLRGVEVAGALKNIIALAAGINRGMGFGDNSAAMLMTRGIAEITRMGIAMGCNQDTFRGLAGIGDLIVTCSSRHSRNNRCGELIGRGMSYEDAAREIGMVVEGYHALGAAIELSEKYGVEMPITRAVDNVLNKGQTVKEAMLSLMNRDLKNELIL